MYSRTIKKLLDDTSYIADSLKLGDPRTDELYIIIDDRSDMWLGVPELSDNFDIQHYLDWQLEFKQVLNKANSAYKIYRIAVREALSV